jgi:hypothetical protein
MDHLILCLDVTSDQHPHDQKNSGADRDARKEVMLLKKSGQRKRPLTA